MSSRPENLTLEAGSAPIAAPMAWVADEVVPIDEARVPLEDRGFLFGEAAYEALLTRDGKAFALDPHLVRLARSLEGMGIDHGSCAGAISRCVEALLREGGGGDGLLYLQVTGGVGPRDHLPEHPPTPAVYGTLRPFNMQALAANQRRGIAVATCPERRWDGAHLKSTQLLPNILAKRAAAEAKGLEAIFVDESGRLLEGGSSNFWLVKEGVAVTAPLSRNVLPGITRSLLLEHAPSLVAERDTTLDALADAEEAFITSTTGPVLAVISVEGRRIGDGHPGPVTRRLAQVMGELMLSAFSG